MVGFDVGLAVIIIHDETLYETPDQIEEYGYGCALTVNHDFDSTPTGVAFQIGLKFNFNGFFIEGDTYSSASICGTVVWK